MQSFTKASQFVSNTFVVWVLSFAILAYAFPSGFQRIAPYIPLLLGVVMFGMGVTISAADFKEILTRPRDVAVGVFGQFTVMPALAYALAKLLNLSPEIAVGFILVGCCPGGTASNVMTYMARGDVALSVTITSVTTLLAPIVTPALIYVLASQWININAGSLLLSIIQIVLLPILLGLAVQRYFASAARASAAALPMVSVIAIVLIVAAVIAVSQARIAETGLQILGVVILHNLLGYLFGYALAAMLKMTPPKRRAVAIEVGMQNSGLGAALAAAHFSPLAAVPSAIFSVWHNISGPIFAAACRRRDN